jgi:long-chain acyl-CoA synthetase
MASEGARVAVTAGSVQGTGSDTMADLLGRAASTHPTTAALLHKEGGAWRETSYADLATIVREVALGLVDLGLEPHERVAILSNTRPEWTQANLGITCAGGVSVAIYQTNSPAESRYALEHSEAVAVVVEDAEQLAKVSGCEAELPELRHVVVIDPPASLDGALSWAELRRRGRGREAAELEERIAAIAPEDPFVIVYTSGTTGPAKGCVLTHANYRSVVTQIEQHGVIDRPETVFLFLPLAHSFALTIQFVALDIGATIAYWERDRETIVANVGEVRPTYFPSIPRVFEKVHTLAYARAEEAGGLKARAFSWAVGVGREVRRRQRAGRAAGPLLRAEHALADRLVLRRVRDLFGGRLCQAITGAAPIDVEVLEFLDACGVKVMEAYGLTETSAAVSLNTPAHHRFGSVGRVLPGMEARFAPDGELHVRGPNVFKAYFRDPEGTALALDGPWLRTGDLGHLDADGFLHITGRKKDLIITAGGKNVTPSNLENRLKASHLVSQAVVVGDRRPYLVALLTLDPDEAARFGRDHGLSPEDVPASAQLRAELQGVVDDVNRDVGRVEQIKHFTVLARDLSQEEGELTPTLKVKRGAVCETYAAEIDRLYERR